MKIILIIVGILAALIVLAWVVLTQWLLPKLGVPT